jgi:hypothetical protein
MGPADAAAAKTKDIAMNPKNMDTQERHLRAAEISEKMTGILMTRASVEIYSARDPSRLITIAVGMSDSLLILSVSKITARFARVAASETNDHALVRKAGSGGCIVFPTAL